MRIACPKCEATYSVPEAMATGGKSVRCARCNEVWLPEAVAVAPAPARPRPTPPSGRAAPSASPEASFPPHVSAPASRDADLDLTASVEAILSRNAAGTTDVPEADAGGSAPDVRPTKKREWPLAARLRTLWASPHRAEFIALLLAWVGSVGAVCVGIGLLLARHDQVVGWWPASARLFGLLGISSEG